MFSRENLYNMKTLLIAFTLIAVMSTLSSASTWLHFNRITRNLPFYPKLDDLGYQVSALLVGGRLKVISWMNTHSNCQLFRTTCTDLWTMLWTRMNRAMDASALTRNTVVQEVYVLLLTVVSIFILSFQGWVGKYVLSYHFNCCLISHLIDFLWYVILLQGWCGVVLYELFLYVLK